MSGSWDPQAYRERAEHWRAQAAKTASGDTRDAYVTISEGYAKLAELIEHDRADLHIAANLMPQTASDSN
jgi:hypothetical protein